MLGRLSSKRVLLLLAVALISLTLLDPTEQFKGHHFGPSQLGAAEAPHSSTDPLPPFPPVAFPATTFIAAKWNGVEVKDFLNERFSRGIYKFTSGDLKNFVSSEESASCAGDLIYQLSDDGRIDFVRIGWPPGNSSCGSPIDLEAVSLNGRNIWGRQPLPKVRPWTLVDRVKMTNFTGPLGSLGSPHLDGIGPKNKERKERFPLWSMERAGQFRYLDTKISKISGLTNQLMHLNNALVAGIVTNRVVVVPQFPDDHVPLEETIDVEATQEALLDLGVVLMRRSTFLALKEQRLISSTDEGRIPEFLDNQAYSAADGSTVMETVQLSDYDMLFETRFANTALPERVTRTRTNVLLSYAHKQVITLSQGMGMLPLVSYQPFGNRFFLRYTVFHNQVRSRATGLMQQLHGKHGVTRLLTLHLRVESDALALAGQSISVTGVANFFREQLSELAEETGCDAIYVCSGRIDAAIEEAARAASKVPVFFKKDFPEISIPRKDGGQGATVGLGSVVNATNSLGAAVDALVMTHSSVFVATSWASTMTTLVSAMRCPGHPDTIQLTPKRFQRIFRRSGSDQEKRESLVEPPPGARRRLHDGGEANIDDERKEEISLSTSPLLVSYKYDNFLMMKCEPSGCGPVQRVVSCADEDGMYSAERETPQIRPNESAGAYHQRIFRALVLQRKELHQLDGNLSQSDFVPHGQRYCRRWECRKKLLQRSERHSVKRGV